MSNEALAPQMTPYRVDIVAGETYRWCAYGRSKNEPYCDNSHKGAGFELVAFAAEKPRPFISAAASGPPIDRFVMTHTICLGKHHFATDKTDTAYLYGCKKTSNQLLCEKSKG